MRDTLVQRLIQDSPVIAFFSVTCLLCCALFVLLAAPQWHTYQERLERVKSYQAYISSTGGGGFDAVHRKLESKNERLRAKLDSLTADMPSRSLSDILQELIRRGKDCGIALAKIQPQYETLPANSEYVSVLLETRTGYDKLGQYIVSLEALPQIIQIRKIAIETAPGGELNVKLLVYCLAGAEGGA